MQKKLSVYILLFSMIISVISLYPKNSFFLLNRDGVLIKVDPASGFVNKYPKNPGPNPSQILKEYTVDEFESRILSSITLESDKNIIKSFYQKDEAQQKYILKKENDNKKDLAIIRSILMFYNKDNEMYTGLGESGAPSPHKFPRVFEAKTKANFDIHFVWGVKFDNFYTSDNVKLGNMMLGFSLNLTNFVMPSLEFMLKYNFYLDKYPVEPYIGAVLYGGFIDGFPIGISAIGGADIFPMHYEDRTDNRNLFLNGEFRLGTVFYTPIYFDTGLNTEGIWKKVSWLLEGGFYTGIGYVWAN